MADDTADTARYFAEVDKELDRRVRRDPRNVARFVKAAAGWAFMVMCCPRKGAAFTTALYFVVFVAGCLGGLSWGKLLAVSVVWMMCAIVLVPMAVLKD